MLFGPSLPGCKCFPIAKEATMSVDEIVKTVERVAQENDKYSGCAQAVLGALQSQLRIGDAESFRAATNLSGGVARRGESCGALLGALMGIGLVCGRDDMKDTAAYGRAVTEAQSIVDDFKARLQRRFGFTDSLTTTLCRDIHVRLFGRAYDLASDADREAFLQAGGHDADKCPLVCAIAAGVAARAILAMKKDV
jgi:C_GCAxxG_C_C family probable redox protein